MEERNMYVYEAPKMITYNNEKGLDEFNLPQTGYLRGKNVTRYAIEDQRKEVTTHVICSFKE